jgi:thioredoxin-like negative regulator of GroEL
MVTELTKENFDSEIIGCDRPVLVKFYSEVGCGYCDKFKPIYEKFAETHPNIKCCAFGVPTLGTPKNEVHAKFEIKAYPTIICIIDGKLIKKEEGGLSVKQMEDMTKTLQNISLEELTEAKLDLDIELSTKRKEMYGIEKSISAVIEEFKRRGEPEIKSCESCDTECRTKCESECEVNDDACKAKCEDWCRHNPNCKHG